MYCLKDTDCTSKLYGVKGVCNENTNACDLKEFLTANEQNEDDTENNETQIENEDDTENDETQIENKDDIENDDEEETTPATTPETTPATTEEEEEEVTFKSTFEKYGSYILASCLILFGIQKKFFGAKKDIFLILIQSIMVIALAVLLILNYKENKEIKGCYYDIYHYDTAVGVIAVSALIIFIHIYLLAKKKPQTFTPTNK